MEPEEFPILDEPFPIEFANTDYRYPQGSIDFLREPRDLQTWFEAMPSAGGIVRPGTGSRSWHLAILELRDATRACLVALASDRRPAAAELRVIVAGAALGTRTRSIVWTDRPRLAIDYAGRLGDRSLAMIGNSVIDFLAGEQAMSVRTCAAADCSMLFVRHHHRRRWCHDGCSHRNRQARYYQRRREEAAGL